MTSDSCGLAMKLAALFAGVLMSVPTGAQTVREWAFPLTPRDVEWRSRVVVSGVITEPVVAGIVEVKPVLARHAESPARWDDQSGPLSVISHHGIDRERLAQMAGKPETVPLMLRSLSAIITRTQPADRVFGRLPVEFQLVNNSALPWSINDGDLWAGRGISIRIGGGFFARFGRFQVTLAPELTHASNDSFELRNPSIERPEIPPDRSPYAFPWYVVGPYSIDMPTRFGEGSLGRVSLGQSSVLVGFSKYQFGFANENEWWGPGISNALILSNNAPGFPHLFLRTARPLNTRLGDLDVRWLVGGLAESFYFDPDPSNDIRSLSAAAVTLRLKRPAGLTLGAARSVWATSTGWGEIPFRWLDVLSSTGRPNNRALNDSSLYPGGRDQVYSLFARWLFPEAGLEVFTEWGRTEFPTSLRDLLIAPNHTQAYTIGFQWRRPGWTADDLWRLHAENTMVEQGPTFRDRPLGVWYTSRTVIQGYTNRGQPLGAAVGPGSSGQNLKVDYMRPSWSFGLEAGRMRYNEDVRSISPILPFKRWCTHDIYLYWGPRATMRSRFGFAAFDFTLANRYHPWFQVQSGCPRGDAMVDIRNNTLRLTFAPLMPKVGRRRAP